jgi:hypothetical protein
MGRNIDRHMCVCVCVCRSMFVLSNIKVEVSEEAEGVEGREQKLGGRGMRKKMGVREGWTTTPSSRARCSGPSSRAGARASSYHKNTNAKVQRANGVVSDTLRQRPQGRLGRPPAARRVCRQQFDVDARRRPDALLHRPGRAVPRTLDSRCRSLATPSPPANHLHTTRSGCRRWR